MCSSDLLEEAIIGVVEGKGIHEALLSAPPGLEHNRLLGMTLVCIIMFFSLMPFFAYLEFEQVIGAKELRGLLFGNADAAADSKTAPTRQLLGAPTDESAATPNFPPALVEPTPSFELPRTRLIDPGDAPSAVHQTLRDQFDRGKYRQVEAALRELRSEEHHV